MHVKSLIQYILAALLALTAANAAFAQANPMRQLAALDGNWEVNSFRTTQNGEQPGRAPGSIAVQTLFGGALFQEVMVDNSGPQAYVMTMLISYDQFRDVYRVAIGDSNGLLDIYEGDWDASGRILRIDNIRADTSFVARNGQAYHFRIEYDMRRRNAPVKTVFISSDGGENWSPYARHELVRLDS